MKQRIESTHIQVSPGVYYPITTNPYGINADILNQLKNDADNSNCSFPGVNIATPRLE